MLDKGRVHRGTAGRGACDHELRGADVAGESGNRGARDLDRGRVLAAQDANVGLAARLDRGAEAARDEDRGAGRAVTDLGRGRGLVRDPIDVGDARPDEPAQGMVDQGRREVAAVGIDDDIARVELGELVRDQRRERERERERRHDREHDRRAVAQALAEDPPSDDDGGRHGERSVPKGLAREVQEHGLEVRFHDLHRTDRDAVTGYGREQLRQRAAEPR